MKPRSVPPCSGRRWSASNWSANPVHLQVHVGSPATGTLIFCKQRRERFLPGLQKLGLDKLPSAVAAAQYHYLSNHIGGVSVEFMYESDRKAWIRYAAPRWLWSGTALCGVPPEVSRARLVAGTPRTA